MEKTNSSKERQVQELILDYFKDTDDKTISELIDAIVYANPITDRKSKTSEVIEKFLKDNGLEKAFLNYMYDYRNESKYFHRASLSEVDMIEKVRTALLNLAYNRLRERVRKKKVRDTNFTFMQKTILDMYERFNSNDNYFYGKEEDAKFVEKIEKMKP